MCAHGVQTLGLRADATFPEVDFAAFARAQGADGVRVRRESELDDVLREAMRRTTPFVVDVLIDPDARPPAGSRNRALARQLVGASPDLSFPTR
jgi:thiamine pyrophosphate-dependent acetolactate synthase large subunit-like protein